MHEIKEWNKDTVYLFGDIIKWDGGKRILATGSCTGCKPSPQFLIWKKYG